MNRNTVSQEPGDESSVYIDHSSRAFQERLELCMLRTGAYDGTTVATELKPFFDHAFTMLAQAAEAGNRTENSGNGTENPGSRVENPGNRVENPEDRLNIGLKMLYGESVASGGENSSDDGFDLNFTKTGKETARFAGLCERIKSAGGKSDSKLCKLIIFWLLELESLIPLREGGSLQALVTAWETTLQLLLEAELAAAEAASSGNEAPEKKSQEEGGRSVSGATSAGTPVQPPAGKALPGEKEWGNILYSYVYDYAGDLIREAEEKRIGGTAAGRLPESPRGKYFITELFDRLQQVRSAEIYKPEKKQNKDESAGEETEEAVKYFLASGSLRQNLGLELFFGDRLKSRLTELFDREGRSPSSENDRRGRSFDREGRSLPGENDQRGTSLPVENAPKLSQHQKKALGELLRRAALCLALLFCLGLTACGGSTEEETPEETTRETVEEYPGLISYTDPESGETEYFGIMHATVLDVQTGDKDGLYVYTLRDKEDPDNVWCLNSQDVGSIFCDMAGGKKVKLLFTGDMARDPDSVSFIAILDDANYELKSVQGTTTQNMMNSFVIRTGKSGDLTFIKDNCKVDKDALSTDGSVRVLVYYAACSTGDLYPLRVYKLPAAD